MRVGLVALGWGAAVLALSPLAEAQSPLKPGLWEATITMTWQQSPFPAGVQLPPQAMAALGGAPRTVQYCLTQAMIDRFGGPLPETRRNCQITDVSKSSSGMTAAMVCTGPPMTGKGTIEAHWGDDGTVKGKAHFLGAVQMGPNPTPVEWSSESTSVFKSSDCGNVQPPAMPADK
jgi:hypothetical protein